MNAAIHLSRPIHKTKLSPNHGKHRLTFKIQAEPSSQVFVCGDFNEWNESSHPLLDRVGNGGFERTVYLPSGRIAYKFIVDGEWTIDCECPHWEPNDIGCLNSVVEVG